MPFHLCLSDVSLCLDLAYAFLARTTTKVIVCPQDAYDAYLSITGDVNLERLIKVASARFLHCHVTIFHFIINHTL